MRTLLIVAFSAVIASCSEESPEPPTKWSEQPLPANIPIKPRWYTQAQVDQGETLFRKNCAICHGQNAEGTSDWKKRDTEGFLPPPPLNGTAHAWHHSRDILRKVVREGGANFGGKMPGFMNLLTDQQIDNIIAWLQSHWGDETYRRWQIIDEQSRAF